MRLGARPDMGGGSDRESARAGIWDGVEQDSPSGGGKQDLVISASLAAMRVRARYDRIKGNIRYRII